MLGGIDNCEKVMEQQTETHMIFDVYRSTHFYNPDS